MITILTLTGTMLCPAPFAPAALTVHNTCHVYTYQTNGTLTIGRDERAGGAVTWLSDNANGFNLVNDVDLGRQLQISNIGEIQEWNPTQAGDGGNPANCERFVAGTGYTYSKCVPWLFISPPGQVEFGPVPDLHFYMWSEFLPNSNGRAFTLKTLSQNKTNKHGDTVNQEMNPVSFFNGKMFTKAVTYNGTAPWTNGATTEVWNLAAGGTGTNSRISEGWMALLDDCNYGVSTMSTNVYCAVGVYLSTSPVCVSTATSSQTDDHQDPTKVMDHPQMWAFDRGSKPEQLREGRVIYYVGPVNDARQFFSAYQPAWSGASIENFDSGDDLGWEENSAAVTVAHDSVINSNAMRIGACGTPTQGQPYEASLFGKYWGDALYRVTLRQTCSSGYGIYGLVIRKGGETHFSNGVNTVGAFYSITIDTNGTLAVTSGANAFSPLYTAYLPSFFGGTFDTTLPHQLEVNMLAHSLTVAVDGVQCINAGLVASWDFKAGYCSLYAQSCEAWFDDFDVIPDVNAPQDASAPQAVTGLSATAVPGGIGLSWTNPTNADWLWTRIVRKENAIPTHWRDGMVVYEGKLSSYVDVDVLAGINYGYAVYTNDHAANYSTAVTAQASPPSAMFTSRPCEDGWILSTSTTPFVGATVNAGAFNDPATLRAGDTRLPIKQLKSILSFDTSALPDTATVTSATIALTCAEVYGTGADDAFAQLGPFYVDIVPGNYGTSEDLEPGDFESLPSGGLQRIGTITGPLVVGQVVFVTLAGTALPKINKTGLTQFRLRFYQSDNGDNKNNFVGFYPAGATNPANEPQLAVSY